MARDSICTDFQETQRPTETGSRSSVAQRSGCEVGQEGGALAQGKRALECGDGFAVDTRQNQSNVHLKYVLFIICQLHLNNGVLKKNKPPTKENRPPGPVQRECVPGILTVPKLAFLQECRVGLTLENQAL